MINFENVTNNDLKNPRFRRAYNRYIREKEIIAAHALIMMKNSQLTQASKILNKHVSDSIEKWEKYKVDTLHPETTGIIPSFRKPAFQLCMQNLDNPKAKFKFTTILERTKDYIVIVPAGYRPNSNNKSLKYPVDTFNSVNPASCRLGGNSALMSLVHVLVIPMKRIYNGITLKKKDMSLVKNMQKAARKWVYYLSNADVNQNYSKEWVLNGNIVNECSRYIKNYYKIKNEDMSQTINTNIHKKITMEDVSTTFHLHPNHSVGWLHMHGFVKDFATTGYDLHSHKNVDVDYVIENIENM